MDCRTVNRRWCDGLDLQSLGRMVLHARGTSLYGINVPFAHHADLRLIRRRFPQHQLAMRDHHSSNINVERVHRRRKRLLASFSIPVAGSLSSMRHACDSFSLTPPIIIGSVPTGNTLTGIPSAPILPTAMNLNLSMSVTCRTPSTERLMNC